MAASDGIGRLSRTREANSIRQIERSKHILVEIDDMSNESLICMDCGHIGYPVRITKGHFALEVLLWLFFLVPGLIYSVWRLTTRHDGCEACGSARVVSRKLPLARQVEAIWNALDRSYYAADDLIYLYPGAGDARPPGGAKVLLLTKGGMCATGPWSNDGRFLGWAPLPKRNKIKEAQL